MKITRREFVILSGVSSAGFLIGLTPLDSQATGSQRTSNATRITDWIQIFPDNRVLIKYSKSEMGQGVSTSLPQILADELDLDWLQVEVEMSALDSGLGPFSTAASASVSSSWFQLRNAGACARHMLIQAAAKLWNVQGSECKTSRGWVLHEKTGHKKSYGELASLAAKEKVPAQVELKTPESFHLVGTSVKRLGIEELVNGQARFSVDVNLPNMRFVTVIPCSRLDAKILSANWGTIKKSPGVIDAFKMRRVGFEGDVGVIVAKSTWEALTARRQFLPVWSEPTRADLSTQKISQTLREWLQVDGIDWILTEVENKTWDPFASKEKESSRFEPSGPVIQGEYELPYLAHMTMEPMSCIAQVESNKCEIWASTQNPEQAIQTVAAHLGTNPNKIKLNRFPLGGGFGRKLKDDYIVEAVEIARRARSLVKVQWTREDDIQRDFFRPYSIHQVAAQLNASQKIERWMHKISAQSSIQVGRGAETSPYLIEKKSVGVIQRDRAFPIATGPLRGISFPPNLFARECFIDEVAAKVGVDPIEFRLRHLDPNSLEAAVLKRVAERAKWKERVSGRAKGVALTSMAGSILAHIVEVSKSQSGPVVHKVWCVVDCGLVVHPDMMRAQVTGGILFGLGSILGEEVTFEKGAVVQKGFGDYPILKMEQTPDIEVFNHESSRPPQGMGEVAVPGISAAAANAFSSLMGYRIRKLPIHRL